MKQKIKEVKEESEGESSELSSSATEEQKEPKPAKKMTPYPSSNVDTIAEGGSKDQLPPGLSEDDVKQICENLAYDIAKEEIEKLRG